MIDVICAHYNEPHNLKRFLIPSLERDGVDGKIILTIVDDGSIPESRQKLKAITEEQPWIRVYRPTELRHGVSRARVYGAAMSDCEWVIFCDAHSRFTHNTVRSANKAMGYLGPGKFICGRYTYCKGAEVITGSGADFRFFVQKPEDHSLVDILRVDRRKHSGRNDLVQAPIGANYLVHRTTWLSNLGIKGLVYWDQFECFCAFKYWKLHQGVAVYDDLVIDHIEAISGAKGEFTGSHLFFNKLFTLWMFMPVEVFAKWKMLLRQLVPSDVYVSAFYRLETVKGLYEKEQKACQFTSYELDEYCDRWSIAHPLSL